MKTTIKILSLILVMGLVVSCSKDEEDPTPALEEASISLSGDAQAVTAPTAMLQSSDPYAQIAAGYITLANSIGSNFAVFDAPSNATKSTTEIVPANGRATGGNVLVYTWTHPQYGSVAYQVKDGGTKYTFELFVKFQGSDGWYRYMYAEEAKDRSFGKMVVLNYVTNEELLRWDWTRSGDNFHFEMTNPEVDFTITIDVNTKTKAGSVVYTIEDEKQYEMEWDAQGNGSWTLYFEGQVEETGTWTV